MTLLARFAPAEGSPIGEGWATVQLPAECLRDVLDALRGRPFPHSNEVERIALRERTLRHFGADL